MDSEKCKCGMCHGALKLIAVLGAALILAVGVAKNGSLRKQSSVICVQGLSEKIVKSDQAQLVLSIQRQVPLGDISDDLAQLSKQRENDLKEAKDFILKLGVKESEIVDVIPSVNRESYEEGKRYRLVSTDKIIVFSDDPDKIKRIIPELMKLNGKGIFINTSYSYLFSKFQEIKEEMMREAAENAKASAEAVLRPYGQSTKGLVDLSQGEITIRGADERSNIERWDSREGESMYKKMRLVVRASFLH